MAQTLEKLGRAILFNITALRKIEEKNHPYLCKLLGQRYGGITRRQRLEQFLKAVMGFYTDEPDSFTDRDGLLWIPIPRDHALIDVHGGGASSWGNNLRLFCVLGLATPYNPDNHGKTNLPQVQHFTAAYEARKRTEQMNAYYKAHPDEYPHKSKSHSPTFYNIPRYGKKRLAEAEKHAAILKGLSVGKWKMDPIRDALGNDEANRAFDVLFNSIGPRTAERRERLKMAALRRFFEDGYFYPVDVLSDALSASDASTAAEAAKGAEAVDIFENYDEPINLEAYEADQRRKYLYLKTWEEYLTPCGLLREMGWKLGQPTRAEKETYHLPADSRKQIVR